MPPRDHAKWLAAKKADTRLSERYRNHKDYPTGTQATTLRDQARQLKGSYQTYIGTRTRFAERIYLEQVYKLIRKWGMSRDRLSRKMCMLDKVAMRSDQDPFNRVINCTSSSKTTRQLKSRWAGALRKAEDQDVAPEGLEEFFNERGGVAGTASQ